MPDVPIRKLPIDLDQFLKIAGVASSGGEVKHLIGEGMIAVNGEAESRRRRKLNSGDVVTVEGHDAFRVAGREG